MVYVVTKGILQIESPSISAIYLTAIMCICGLSIVLQMAVLNCYYVYPLRDVPRWIRNIEGYLSCLNVRTVGCGKSTLSPRHPEACENHVEREESTRIAAKKRESTKPSDLERSIHRGIEVITKKIVSDAEEAMLRQEWVAVARLFDRLLFLIFCTLHFAMIIVIFVILPAVWLLSEVQPGHLRRSNNVRFCTVSSNSNVMKDVWKKLSRLRTLGLRFEGHKRANTWDK